MKRIEDERILSGKRRINSTAFSICFIALWIIVLYRQFILEQNINEYMDIFLLLIGITLYIVINNILHGYYLTYRKRSVRKKSVIIGAVVGTIVFATTQIILMDYNFSNTKDILNIILGSAIFFAVWLISQFVMLKISNKQANKDIE